jgi:hypothetical protein
MDCGVDGAGGVGFDSATDTGLSTVALGCGVEVAIYGCDWTEGVEGAC